MGSTGQGAMDDISERNAVQCRLLPKSRKWFDRRKSLKDFQVLRSLDRLLRAHPRLNEMKGKREGGGWWEVRVNRRCEGNLIQLCINPFDNAD